MPLAGSKTAGRFVRLGLTPKLRESRNLRLILPRSTLTVSPIVRVIGFPLSSEPDL